MPGMQHMHDPAGRLAAHAAALQPARAGPAFASPQDLSQQPLPMAAAASTNWAADFTRMQQSRPAPAVSRQAPMQQMNMQAAFGGPAQMQQPAFSSFFAPAGAAYAGPGAVQQQPVGEADFDQEMAQWMASNGGATGNMTQVDAAMEQMARELELNDAALAQAETTTPNQEHFSDLGVPEMTNLSLEARDAILPEQMLEQEQEHEQPQAEDEKGRSAVSEAAERLLESVQHESGEKWQNSVFLSLMRDFRDGRKDIVDNEIRQTDGEEPEPAPEPVPEP